MAEPLTREPASLAEVRADAAGCRRCGLWRNATQTVFGEGPTDAPLMLVGEQPGDVEDREGRPFVGPAGRLLDRALAEAGLERERLYLTNGVKHFKNVPRGKRRLHKKPDAGEVQACRFWLELELRSLRPPIVVAMGATAARAVFGRPVPVMRERGHFIELEPGCRVFITIHPSALLRVPDPDAKKAAYGRFVDELRLVAEALPDRAA